MTAQPESADLATIVGVLVDIQDRLAKVAASNARLEKVGQAVLRRLDALGEGQVTIASVAARAHAAAMGNRAPLPTDVADAPILERYLLNQPEDRTATAPALMQWRSLAAALASSELASLLSRLYQPSPTDTAETRMLRYRRAAIARDELRGRGVAPPAAPGSTIAEDRTPEAMRRRSADLARIWRAGESADLYAEPELAGAIAMFVAAENRGGDKSEQQLSAELVDLHRAIAVRLEHGERPSQAEPTPLSHERTSDVEREQGAR